MLRDSALVAIVQLRKNKAWVLPKGKLKSGEDTLAAAQREAREETGHDVAVHEYLGEMASEPGARPKIVQFWRMQADGKPTRQIDARREESEVAAARSGRSTRCPIRTSARFSPRGPGRAAGGPAVRAKYRTAH